MLPRKINLTDIEKYQDQLRQTPECLTDWTKDLSESALRSSPQAGEWSPVEILTHLRACAAVWSYSIYAMLTLDEPVLPDIHPREWAKTARYEYHDFQASLAEFTFSRYALLLVLEQLPNEAWSRSATIGSRVHTVYSQVRRMAKHEALHCEQIEQISKLNVE